MKSSLLKYLLGMLIAYGLLFLLFVAILINNFLASAFRNALTPTGHRELGMWGIILLLVPAFYSVFLIGKGYFGEGGPMAPFKWWIKIIVSMLMNGFIALFLMLKVNFLLRGGTLPELIEITQKNIASIGLKEIFSFMIGFLLLVVYVWFTSKKSMRKDKKKKPN